MSLSVGIVGLPNVGKSTLFNALLKKQQALAANYPFATIEPNVGIVEIKDERINKLAETVEKELKLEQGKIPRRCATIEFVDIAGLVAGASKGEGLGNQFLANIREVDLICHVLRAFENSDVVITGKMDPIEDLQTVRTELILKDLETIKNNQKVKIKDLEEKKKKELLFGKIEEILNRGEMLNTASFSDEEMEFVKPLCFLTIKPEIYVINLAETDLKNPEKRDLTKLNLPSDRVVFISAKMEAELAQLSDSEQEEYLVDLSLEQSGIEQMARLSYQILDLLSFLTVGEIEARAWTVKKSSTAVEASGVIHTDFAKKFIKTQIVPWQTFVELRGWKNCREQGKVRQEGRDYIVQDGDVVEFMIGK